MGHAADGWETNADAPLAQAWLQTCLGFANFPHFRPLHYPEAATLYAGGFEDSEAT